MIDPHLERYLLSTADFDGDLAHLPAHLTVRQLSVLLNVTYQTVWKYVRDGTIKAIKVGAHYRISREEAKHIVTNGFVASPPYGQACKTEFVDYFKKARRKSES